METDYNGSGEGIGIVSSHCFSGNSNANMLLYATELLLVGVG